MPVLPTGRTGQRAPFGFRTHTILSYRDSGRNRTGLVHGFRTSARVSDTHYQRSGELDDFFADMIPADDAVWPRAKRYIDEIPPAVSFVDWLRVSFFVFSERVARSFCGLPSWPHLIFDTFPFHPDALRTGSAKAAGFDHPSTHRPFSPTFMGSITEAATVTPVAVRTATASEPARTTVTASLVAIVSAVNRRWKQ